MALEILKRNIDKNGFLLYEILDETPQELELFLKSKGEKTNDFSDFIYPKLFTRESIDVVFRVGSVPDKRELEIASRLDPQNWPAGYIKFLSLKIKSLENSEGNVEDLCTDLYKFSIFRIRKNYLKMSELLNKAPIKFTNSYSFSPLFCTSRKIYISKNILICPPKVLDVMVLTIGMSLALGVWKSFASLQEEMKIFYLAGKPIEKHIVQATCSIQSLLLSSKINPIIEMCPAWAVSEEREVLRFGINNSEEDPFPDWKSSFEEFYSWTFDMAKMNKLNHRYFSFLFSSQEREEETEKLLEKGDLENSTPSSKELEDILEELSSKTPGKDAKQFFRKVKKSITKAYPNLLETIIMVYEKIKSEGQHFVGREYNKKVFLRYGIWWPECQSNYAERIIILIDSSASVTERDLEKAWSALLYIYHSMRIGNLVIFSGDTELYEIGKITFDSLSGGHESLKEIYDLHLQDSIKGGGGTNMGKLVEEISERFEKDKSILIVLTDGETLWCDNPGIKTIVALLRRDLDEEAYPLPSWTYPCYL